jgi:hypothetical protein
MKKQHFDLKPFSDHHSLPNIQIIGSILRQNNILTLDYKLLGNLVEIEIASPSQIPKRKHELWQETCFEFFLGVTNSPCYWEFNLSPSGDWNVYHFHDYRQEMQEETAFTSLPLTIHQQSESLSLSLNLDLEAIIAAEKILDVAITTVIKQCAGHITYWALTHCGAEADFHQRDSFLIKLLSS